MAEIEPSDNGGMLFVALCLVFVISKLSGSVDWSWWWILSPIILVIVIRLIILITRAKGKP